MMCYITARQRKRIKLFCAYKQIHMKDFFHDALIEKLNRDEPTSYPVAQHCSKFEKKETS